MFTAKFYTAGRKDAIILEAASVEIHKDDAGAEIVLTYGTGLQSHILVGPSFEYRFAVIENAAGKTTEIIGQRP